MDEVLRKFNGDPHTKEFVKEYISEYIKQEGVIRIFDRKDVSAVADAHELIMKAFEQLSIDYGTHDKPKNPINQSK